MSDLVNVIKAKIRENGPISFRDYMDLSLYHPQFGYYNTKSVKIGKQGDFYTSAYLGNSVGAMIARKMEEFWCILGKQRFTIVEYGAGTGKLTEDILIALRDKQDMYAKLRYCIIEKSPAMVDLEKLRLQEKVEWFNDITEVKEICGCVLSNELLDNFPVHRVVMQEQLMEVFVDYRHGFKEILRPASPALTNYFSALGLSLPAGFKAEVNLQAISWIKAVAEALTGGYVLTIDYGGLNEEMYRNKREGGTLRCYTKHSVNDDYYHHVGKQDLTAHVNFSALRYWGQKYGLREILFSCQGEFLLQMGFNDWLMANYSGATNVALAAQKIAMLRNTLILDMGSKFKVLIQEKRMEGKSAHESA